MDVHRSDSIPLGETILEMLEVASMAIKVMQASQSEVFLHVYSLQTMSFVIGMGVFAFGEPRGEKIRFSGEIRNYSRRCWCFAYSS